ncbi:hypothetical protein AMAG_17410 [Allomyces macrogynus ATCC 38327]|uniref:Bms1-type G domain-containing protein n=1 Tax=Allomyces macrogynus (strain ATCC 38327) TaxID=578462 RepID=A0A0L0TF48_ALLM3|nr:hypothetical protein AMAG_17410 [Allomyces macrogynus ATCC 38327]|eukprot:KNE73224.1 hypothetical protein AMAG_17410 [Allomyces macrogynus ATCC 38327]
MSAPGHSHRSTLKQSNKPFKGGHASKRTLKNKAKGKVERGPGQSQRASVKAHPTSEEAKANRRNAAKLAQQNKRAEHLAMTRMFQGRSGCPKMAAVVPLCPDADLDAALAALFGCMDVEYAPSPRPVAVLQTRFKQRIEFLKTPRDLIEILDAVKVADFVIFVLSAVEEVDAFGELVLTSILAQGLPLAVPVIQHLDRAPGNAKYKLDVRKSLASYMSFWSPATDKLYALNEVNECVNAVRYMTDHVPKHLSWREKHPYMVPDRAVPVPPESGEADMVDLQVTGFLRGNRFSASRLVHVPGMGDFQVDKVVSAPLHGDFDAMDTSDEVLDVPDPDDADDLVSENEPDDMMNEQTWPTDEELSMATLASKSKKTKRVPKGTSAYQAAWIVDSDNDDESDAEDLSGDEDETSLGGMNAGSASSAPPALDRAMDWSHVTGHTNGSAHAHDDDLDSGAAGSSIGSPRHAADDDDEYEDIELDDRASVWDTKMDAAEQAKQLAQYLEQRRRERAEAADEDLEFPDEVETPQTVPAKVRFQRYRGLKSFRKSPWDPYENLPRDCARLFQFENFGRTKQRVIKDQTRDAAVPAGKYVTVHLKNVPQHIVDVYDLDPLAPVYDATTPRKRLLWIVGLLQYEHKKTTVNFTVTRRDEYTAPIRSKDPVVIQAGWRRFHAAPIYSEHARDGGNHVFKMERFLQPKRPSVGTMYAPTTFTGPVLMLQPGTRSTAPALMATGSILSADANRIVVKRIVLTGHPFKIHKKIAVLRWMFFSPEDVMWFKPVQLYTKFGRTGHIRESLGTHGYMKCIFDGPVMQHDTVCMPLFKRMFPKQFAELVAPAACAVPFPNAASKDLVEVPDALAGEWWGPVAGSGAAQAGDESDDDAMEL